MQTSETDRDTTGAGDCIRRAIDLLQDHDTTLADALRPMAPAATAMEPALPAGAGGQRAADLLRDAALALEFTEPALAGKLVSLALGIRPRGPRLLRLQEEIAALKDVVARGSSRIGDVRLEFGETPPPPLLRALFSGEYERQELALLRKFLAQGDSVLELGSGLGYLGISAVRTGRCARYVGFEANPRLIPLIGRNMASNDAHFELRHGLLGERAGECDFHLAPDFWASSLIAPAGGDCSTVRVPVFDKNEIVRALAPSLLIVDIEGGEAELFADWDIRSVRKIILEIHPQKLSDRQLSTLYRSLLERGFVLDFKASYKNVVYWYDPNRCSGG